MKIDWVMTQRSQMYIQPWNQMNYNSPVLRLQRYKNYLSFFVPVVKSHLKLKKITADYLNIDLKG